MDILVNLEISQMVTRICRNQIDDLSLNPQKLDQHNSKLRACMLKWDRAYDSAVSQILEDLKERGKI